MRVYPGQQVGQSLAGLYQPPDDLVTWASPMSMSSFDLTFMSLAYGSPTAKTLMVGTIPNTVTQKLGWRANRVLLTPKDVLKLRFHPAHGMSPQELRMLMPTIEHGDYYKLPRGTDLQIEVALHSAANPAHCHYLVLARNNDDSAIFLRTFYFSKHIGKNKMRGGTLIRTIKDRGFFKL